MGLGVSMQELREQHGANNRIVEIRAAGIANFRNFIEGRVVGDQNASWT